MPTSTLNCPSCGAVISSDATQCPYCTAKLATISCPSCFGLAFAGSKFCPHCGKPLIVAADDTTTLACPRCKTDMEHKELAGVALADCPKCAGIWLKAQTFDQICADREKSSAVLGGVLGPGSIPVEPNQATYLPCPQCHELMNRTNFAHRSGVIIDICKPHGIWFDTNELQKIVDFIKAGGLDRAREIEKEQLIEERKRLEGIQLSNSMDDQLHNPSLFTASGSTRYDLISGAINIAGDILFGLLK